MIRDKFLIRESSKTIAFMCILTAITAIEFRTACMTRLPIDMSNDTNIDIQANHVVWVEVLVDRYDALDA